MGSAFEMDRILNMPPGFRHVNTISHTLYIFALTVDNDVRASWIYFVIIPVIFANKKFKICVNGNLQPKRK
jgi:hypothetical protein